jgi:glycosyltransferase involved in cell wall biosynthesis
VLGQIDVEVEVIVVDEASSDGTIEAVESLGDSRIVLVRHETARGPAMARNAGIERARASWVAFVDDDDLWSPARLAAQLDALAAAPESGWAVAGAVVLDGRLRIFATERPPPREETLERLYRFNVIPGGASAVIARTELVRSLGGFDAGLRIMADWDMWIRLATASPLTPVSRPLVGYVLHGGNMTSAPEGIVGELKLIQRKHGEAMAAAGIEMNELRWLDWLADMQRRSGKRLAPARMFARLAVATRRPRLAVRAAGVVVWPGWVVLRDRQRARRLDRAWTEEADAWLEPVRAT